MKRHTRIQRTRWEHKPYIWPRSVSTLKRSTLRAGRKTKDWDRERRILKLDSIKHDRTTCELRGHPEVPHECTFDNFLGYAHAKKRRKLSAEELKIAIIACNNGHDVLELKTPEDMERIVMEVIANRDELLARKAA